MTVGPKMTLETLPAETWRSVPISEVLEEISMGPFGSDIKVSNFVSWGIPVLNGSNVKGYKVSDHFTNYLTPKKAKSLKKAVASRGDIIVTHRGTLGQVSYIPEDSQYELYVISQSQFRVRLRSQLVHPEWVVRYFLSPVGAAKLLEKKGHTGVPALAQPTKNFRELEIPLPPHEEQVAILRSLRDVDELIGSLERLIAKKRDIKQAVMQQLLTGKTRLPGFSDVWEVKRLDSLAEIRSGGTPSTTESRFWDGGVPWCTPTDITALNGRKYLHGTARTISQLGLCSSSAEMIPARSVVMTSRATIGECAINVAPVATNQGFKNFIPFTETDVDFLYYLLGTQKQGFISLCGGSTFLEIGKTQLSAYEVRLPSTKAEQSAIASVLSEIDSEIATLERRLEKTRLIKQGMMQQLLTGKVRLV